MDEDSGRISRRKLLLTAGTSAALGLAGCPSYVTFCPWVGLKRLRTGDEEIREFIHYGGYVFGGLLIAIGLAIVLLFGPF